MKSVFEKFTTLLFLWAILFLSCGKDDTTPKQPVDPGPTGYKQYGTPFKDVPATEDIVMYEVNLRAFSPGGNLKGVTNRLDSLKQLGVNVIWLMPIYPAGQIKSVGSPYSVKDYKAVGPEYGSLQDVRTLTDEAHARGMAVMLDWVANHTAWDNDWIKNKSWYTQDASGNIIHPPGTNWMDVADLNYGNSDMRKAMIDALKFWAYEANIDGYRCDYADGVPFDFWKQAFDSLKLIPNRKFVLFAEGTRQDHFDAGFDLNFGWEFYGGIKNAFNGQAAGAIFTAHNKEYNNLPSGKHWIRFTTNHDESAWDATLITLFNGVNGTLAASVVTVFTGGVPLIYTGQEVGTANKVPFFTNSAINWNNNPGMLQAYKNMLQFYAGSATARKGANTVYPHHDVVCFKKSLQGEDLLILVNIRNNSLPFTLPPEFQNSNWKNAFTGAPVALGSQLQMDAYAYLVLKK